MTLFARKPRALAAAVAGTVLAVTGLSGCGGASNADAVRDDGSVDLSKVTLVVGDQKGGNEALLSAAGDLDEILLDVFDGDGAREEDVSGTLVGLLRGRDECADSASKSGALKIG